MFSLYPISGTYLSGIGIHRKPGLPDFTPRERRIIHVVAAQIDWLHRVALPGPSRHDPNELSPRLRVVFMLMLQGWNRKEIAAHLGITALTAAGYQKQVYRHFDVGSQPALLAQFVRGDGGDLA